ncbi:MAG: DUF4399 domain-containing protein [Longimicrobiales bacterium]
MRSSPECPELRSSRLLPTLLSFVLVAGVAGCGGETQQEGQPQEEEAMEEMEPAGGEPRVFFQQPQQGDTVTSPAQVVFGSENIEIGAVPEEFDEPREGVVHYHLGYDTECLPPGEVIPEADPWIHFGDGSDSIELEFPEPGEYQLSVQAGDDEHRTIEGLCETIEITVASDD